LFGGRSSRLVRALVRDHELAGDVRGSLSPLHDPGLLEIFVSAREGVSAEQLLECVDREIDRLLAEPISLDELARVRARIELGLLQGLSTNEGKASTIGFYEVVLGNPSAGFDRLLGLLELDPQQLLLVAQKYLNRHSRTVIVVQPQSSSEEDSSETALSQSGNGADQ